MWWCEEEGGKEGSRGGEGKGCRFDFGFTVMFIGSFGWCSREGEGSQGGDREG